MNEIFVRLAAIGEILQRGAGDPRSFLVVATALFSLGLFAAMSRRDAAGLLAGLALALFGGCLAFAAFASFARSARAPHAAGEGSVACLLALFLAISAAIMAAALLAILRRPSGECDLDRLDSLEN